MTILGSTGAPTEAAFWMDHAVYGEKNVTSSSYNYIAAITYWLGYVRKGLGETCFRPATVSGGRRESGTEERVESI